MKIAITGGFGFIGKNFLKKYSRKYDFIIFSKKTDELETLTDNLIIENFKVEDPNIINSIINHKPDVILHMASLTGIKRCEENPFDAFKKNVYGTFNVIKACSQIKSKLIFTSSREVYGETLAEESREDDTLVPNNVYGITKMIGECLIKTASNSNNFDYTILRLTNVYGPHGNQGINYMINSAINNKKIQIIGGTQLINHIYVDDVVEVINLILDNKFSSKETFNVGSEQTLTVNELANQISRLAGNNVELEYLPIQDFYSHNFKPSIAKLKSLLGFNPPTNIEKGLELTISWIRRT